MDYNTPCVNYRRSINCRGCTIGLILSGLTSSSYLLSSFLCHPRRRYHNFCFLLNPMTMPIVCTRRGRSKIIMPLTGKMMPDIPLQFLPPPPISDATSVTSTIDMTSWRDYCWTFSSLFIFLPESHIFYVRDNFTIFSLSMQSMNLLNKNLL